MDEGPRGVEPPHLSEDSDHGVVLAGGVGIARLLAGPQEEGEGGAPVVAEPGEDLHHQFLGGTHFALLQPHPGLRAAPAKIPKTGYDRLHVLE